ncbi:MAG: V-type ATP synthase subunit D [Bdellovibrionales bacterium RIFOXYA1_FULL_36_14]|nr:MAG: V-type ATP synthase subunit D [Bdellovibrionales bacterium RIFOXYA1_FULL_36_14]
MALKFQYNKTELQKIEKQLKQRYKALPTLKNKESALRAEVKKYKDGLKILKEELRLELAKINPMLSLFTEYKDLVSVKGLKVHGQKIAGVTIPTLDDVEFEIKDFSVFNNPSWFLDGTELIKHIAKLKIVLKIEQKKIEILEYARKKTTQKVNLYEKVQIPAFEEAIIKIKRFLADEENLDRASQKIVKKRKAAVL